mmetsp:Transcript_35903/g.26175  ORF Transcript_35903/g.26175 Transcript_35903/m.26175 type:complete len:82 (+) Transcript_35903:60-305(+)
MMHNFNDWNVGENYRCIKIIGAGADGLVAEAIHRRSNKKVAIKRLKGIFKDSNMTVRYLREIQILLQSKNKNIVKLHDIII